MSDLRDFTGKNRKHTGTTGITVSDNGSGTSGRVAEKGRLRFNDDNDIMNIIMVLAGLVLTLHHLLQG